MPPLPGFSDNQFRDRQDVLNATTALVRGLKLYFSPGKARVQLPVYSGAHFDEAAAQLEGFARPLWAFAAAVADDSDIHDPEIDQYVQSLVEGLVNGVNPAHPEYWGAIGDWDQRMVEAEPIAFALLMAPKRFYEPLSQSSRAHLADWLCGLNGKVMPENNWRWFRVFANLALSRVCGVPYDQVKSQVDEDFAMLDRFEIGHGWSADGIWRPDSPDAGHKAYSRQADYYSGSFALQFSQLLYCIVAAASDPDRVAHYRRQARTFASQFWRFFDEEGAAIPFGRSLTYRFAMGAFYAAFALAKCYDGANRYTSPGFVKGMLLRHLRWWAKHSTHVFAVDGTLTVGYLYPNMFMCEDYNSPQSPYWAMKALVVLGLRSDDQFWTAVESPHPLSLATSSISGVEALEAPSQILCDHVQGRHHFLLSGGQFCMWPLKATQAKYSKFAYSSAFAFSVPTGNLLTQLAPDSTLVVSRDGGNTWATRWETMGTPRLKSIAWSGIAIQCLQATWKPWKTEATEIETTLIPPCDHWPDWHIRVHRVVAEAAEKLLLVEGGFAVQAKQPRRMEALDENWGRGSGPEGTLETAASALVFSTAGVSGLTSLLADEGMAVEGKVLKSDPNTNLIEPRALIPTIQLQIDVPSGGKEIFLATAVFAIAKGKKPFTRQELFQRWSVKPRFQEVLARIQ